MTPKVMVAAELFAERGLDGATMSDIAEVTGIPRATLYYYFEGKEAVFAHMCALVLDAFEDAISVALADEGSAAERLGRVIRAQLEFCAAHPAAFLAVQLDLGRAARRADMSERMVRGYLRPVARLLEEGAADATMRPVANPRAVAAAILGAVTTAVEQALLSRDELSVAGLHETIMSLVLHGVDVRSVTPAGQR
jgi:AcrR family transcriptional regulator